ncbi:MULTISPECIES: hypothetical protein [unclassified Vibrio]|uniref:hypothetical protein n=1 Tax=unclassified Vibrio TaxID=2614977 RepID=UPI002F41F0A4
MGKTLPNLNDEAILDLTKQKQVLKIIAVITLVTFVPLVIKNSVPTENVNEAMRVNAVT